MRKALSHTELVSDNKQIDHEVKMVQKQIALAEKSLANLLKDFTNISVDLTRLHSRQEELCVAMSTIASEESPVLKENLIAVSNHLEIVLEALKTHVSVIQERVLNPISEKAKSCKETRSILDKCSDAKKQRTAAIKALGKTKKISKHNNNTSEQYTNTVLESTKQLNELSVQMTRFEKSKAEDFKTFLKTYIHSNLAYHVKAVEQYTKAYQAISLVDVDKHVEHFVQSLAYSEKSERGKFVRWNSLTSLNSK